MNNLYVKMGENDYTKVKDVNLSIKLYSVLVEYTNFEDEDSNYSELIGVFSDEKKAIKVIKKQVKDEIANDMKLSDNDMNVKDLSAMLDAWGYVALEQKCGYGETRIILSENELDKESV